MQVLNNLRLDSKNLNQLPSLKLLTLKTNAVIRQKSKMAYSLFIESKIPQGLGLKLSIGF